MSVPAKTEDADNETVAASKNPELDRIKSYFDGTIKHRFNGFGRRNDHSFYYNRNIHPESDRTRACASVEWVAFAEIAQDTRSRHDQRP